MTAFQKEYKIEVNEIQKMMDLLSNLFSIRTAFIYAIGDEQYTNEIAGKNGDYQGYCILIQKELKQRCIACDRDKFKEANLQKEPLLYQCYNGLYEMFLPLFIESNLVGYLHFGQVRGEDDFEIIAEAFSLLEHSKLSELEDLYNSMKVFEKEKLVQISELFQKFSDLILKNQLIEVRRAEPEYYLKKYVEENFSKTITVQSAAEFVKRSPSYVTHKFKELYGVSFHQYLKKMRAKRAMSLLKDHTIEQTFQQCGFKNRYHFSKVFKKVAGVTPRKYQNSIDRG